MTPTSPSLEVNPKDALPSGAPVDRVVLRYSDPSHRAFFSSVMQRLQQPEVSPRQLVDALSVAVAEMEAEEARKAEEAARKAEEEARKKAEKEAEEKRRAGEESRRLAEETKKKAEEETRKKALEEAKRRAEEKAWEEEEARKAQEEAEARRVLEDSRRAQETARKAVEAARAAEAEAKKAEEEAKKRLLSSRACGVCASPNPSARAVFATCGHVACLKCAEAAASRGTRLECPFCAAPTTYMRLFEREIITKDVVESAVKSSPKGVRFSDTDEVKEFERDDGDIAAGIQKGDDTKGPSLGCGMGWFGKKN